MKSLLLFSACLSACFLLGRTDFGREEHDSYNGLMNLLLKRYKIYKREHEISNYRNNKGTFNSITKRSEVHKPLVVTPIHEDDDSNDITKLYSMLISQKRRNVFDSRVAGEKGVNEHSVEHADVNGNKRDGVPVHVVTPVHDDDSGDGTQTQKKDFIIPVHDDELDSIQKHVTHDDNVEDAKHIVPVTHDDNVEDAKHIVPVHDDDDDDDVVEITDHVFSHKGTSVEDSKTFITVKGKKERGKEMKNYDIDAWSPSSISDEGEEERKFSDYKGDNDENEKFHLENDEVYDSNEKGNQDRDSETYHAANKVKLENVLAAVDSSDKKDVEPANLLSNEIEASKVNESSKEDHGKEELTTEIHTIKMPDVSPKVMDTYYCFPYKLPDDDRYIVEYRPQADREVAHHILLFACGQPYEENEVWSCREMAPVCKGGGQSIMYAWAKNAPPLKMPTNVGFHVGGKSGFNYLVLQVHYLHVSHFKNGKTDDSGLQLTLDKINKRYLAGIYLLADGYTPIPPHKKKSHIDMGCYYSEGPRFFPFRFRTHAHKLGIVITGYHVRNNKWTLIGRGDPQRPQAFYRVFNDIDVEPGDTIMAQCTYNSMDRNTTTYIGATHSDEMCNFYIMYFYDSHKYDNSEFPCEDVTMTPGSLFERFPEDSDIPLATMEEANRISFATYGVKDMGFALVHDWPIDGLRDGDLPLTVGQISGVDVTTDGTQVVIIQRGDRYWGSDTFTRGNILVKKYHVPIKINTLIWLDRETGSIKKVNGANMFYLPHGITIDGEGNIWITDVGSHQVYKLSPDMELLLTLGKKFFPGTGDKHFCKPTDVAVMKDGDFFVSDGYCNNRVVKFGRDGTMLLQISADRAPNIGLFPGPNDFMSVVHSLALDEEHSRLFVADRENGRILVFHSRSGIYLTGITDVKGAVDAVAYNHNQGGVLHFVTGPLSDNPVTLSGYTYSFISNSIVSQWTPDKGFTLAHDIAVTKDNQDLFVAEINPYKIWKLSSKAKFRP